jgi:bifunctional non-homologous end joining protein LigD
LDKVSTMGLKQYKAKRNFLQTAEPAGSAPSRTTGKRLRFVIQKHAASHLHYDFRLEMEGVLRSWAVPKGLPLRRGDRRLAVEVEDHPIEYGCFEGTIAAGNYGAGTVMLWDQGTYKAFGDDPLASFRSGKIHFVLAGKKLKGEWTLVRMRDSGVSKPQWLLLKTGGDLPRLPKSAEDQSVLSGRSMEEISTAKRRHEWVSNRTARDNDGPATIQLKGSVRAVSAGRRRSSVSRPKHIVAPEVANGDDSALKALPSSPPQFVEPMKAQLVSRLPSGPEWLFEIKFDGVRALALKKDQQVTLISRSGKDLGAKYNSIVDALQHLPADQVVLDGEVVAVDNQGRSAFQLLQSYQSAGTKPPLLYYVFDILQFNGKSLVKLPLWRRKELAEKLIDGAHPQVRFSGNIQANSARLVKAMQAQGLEGLVAKKRESSYEPGRRSGAWIKFKWTNQQEFVIGGYTRPQGARSHFGAILVGYYHGKNLLFAAKVGTGFNEQTLHELYGKFQKLAATKCPFSNLPEKGPALTAGLSWSDMKRCSWIRPELVCEVRFAEWTRDHHLRQPAYLGLREDKSPSAVVRESPAAVQD